MTALLDWEFCHLGDPMDDLGGWLFRGYDMAAWQGDLAAQLRRWSERTGLAVDRRSVEYYRAVTMVRWLVSVATTIENGGSGMDRSVHYALVPVLSVRLPRALATLLDVDLPAPGPRLASAEPGPGAPVLAALRDDLREVIGPAVEGSEARRRLAAAEIYLSHLEAVDRVGARVAEDEAADVAATLGARTGDRGGRPARARRPGRPYRPRPSGRHRSARVLLAPRPSPASRCGRSSSPALAGPHASADRTRDVRRRVPMGLLTERDDDLHPPATDDRWWSETYWFSFDQPGVDLSATIYPVFRPNAGVCSLAVYLWDASGSTPWTARYGRSYWHLTMPETPLTDLRLEGLTLPDARAAAALPGHLPRTATSSPSTSSAPACGLRTRPASVAASATSTSRAGSSARSCSAGSGSRSTRSACATAPGRCAPSARTAGARPTPTATDRPTTSSSS